MSPLKRLSLVVFPGLLLGWGIGGICYPEAPAPVVSRPVIRPPLPAAKPGPEWQRWLDETVLWETPENAAAFWKLISSSATLPAQRQEWYLDAACLGMSWEAFSAVLQDPLFMDFNPKRPGSMDPDEKEPGWWRRLWEAGLDAAISLHGKLPTKSLNTKLEHLLIVALARADPEKGFTWVRSLTDPANPMAGFLFQVAQKDFHQATELWGRLKIDETSAWSRAISTSARNFSARQMLQAMAGRDWQTALNWAQSHLP